MPAAGTEHGVGDGYDIRVASSDFPSGFPGNSNMTMENRNITSRVSPTSQGRTGPEEYRLEDCDGLAHWVVQLDTAQRQAHAAHVQDRIRILDRMLELIVNAKREGKLCCDHDGCASRDRVLSNGGVRTPGKGSTNAATTP